VSAGGTDDVQTCATWINGKDRPCPGRTLCLRRDIEDQPTTVGGPGGMLESGATGDNLVEIGSVRAHDVDGLGLLEVVWVEPGDSAEGDLLTVRREHRFDIEPSSGDLTRV